MKCGLFLCNCTKKNVHSFISITSPILYLHRFSSFTHIFVNIVSTMLMLQKDKSHLFYVLEYHLLTRLPPSDTRVSRTARTGAVWVIGEVKQPSCGTMMAVRKEGKCHSVHFPSHAASRLHGLLFGLWHWTRRQSTGFRPRSTLARCWGQTGSKTQHSQPGRSQGGRHSAVLEGNWLSRPRQELLGRREPGHRLSTALALQKHFPWRSTTCSGQSGCGRGQERWERKGTQTSDGNFERQYRGPSPKWIKQKFQDVVMLRIIFQTFEM